MMSARIASALAAVVVSICVAMPARAAIGWMTDGELQTVFAGKSLEGRYANGRAFTERYGADGRVAYMEAGRSVMGGHWSVTAGTFCTIYDQDGSGGCFRVSRAGKNCYEFYFITRTEEDATRREDEKPSWTARGSVSGVETSCEDGANV